MSNLKDAVNAAKEMLLENEEFRAKLKDVTTITGFKDFIDGFVPLWSILKMLVTAVEVVYSEYHKCTEEERIDVAAELLDDLIEFKGWLSIFEPFDSLLFKLIISAAVQALNDKLGKQWFSDATNPQNLLANVS